MSLINDALKRAQRQRKADEAGYAPPVPGQTGGHTVAHRGKPMTTQTLILIVAGAAALVMLSVVATVYLLRDDTPTVPTPAAPATLAQTPVQPAPASDSAPQVVLSIPPPAEQPAETPPAEIKPTPTPAPVPAPVAPSEKAPAAVAAATTPAATTPTAATPAAPAPLPPTPSPAPVAPAVTPDQQVLIYLDNLRILGVRFSGIDSKVLIGDRVFRINDVIERNFGLKLVEVQPDRLFFVDARGVTYAKNL